ncbi:MAG: hypothetical protein WCX48_03605 [Bacteroidales bacterium]
MGTKGTIFSLIVLSAYLISTIGVGRYSCFCDHASKITFFGISSECTCVEEIHKKDPNHHCPCCGAHLISKEPNMNDCCSLKYFFLDSDQDSYTDSYSYTISVSNSLVIKPVEFLNAFTQPVITPKIKTFQALFHQVTESLFEKYLQLIL